MNLSIMLLMNLILKSTFSQWAPFSSSAPLFQHENRTILLYDILHDFSFYYTVLYINYQR